MRVRMKAEISGTRDGGDWPRPGEILDVSDDEGAHLCAAGLAAPVADKSTGVEKTVAPADNTEERTSGLTTTSTPVKRGPGRPRKTT